MTRRQKKRLVNFLAGVLCTLCLGMVIGTVYAGNLNRSAPAAELESADVSKEEEVQPVNEADEEPGEEEKQPEEDLPDDWNLILVNRTHPLPDDFEVELKSIGNGHQIDARAYDDYKEMMDAARKDGISIYVTSSYRSMDKQISLHEAKIEEGVMMDYSYAEAKERAAEVVAVPGTSEHQAGLALDLVSSEYRRLNEKQEQTKGFQWLKEHCYDYGFILRYPNGKTEITGIIYEPWHFRYVGKKAAREIRVSGQTLEEYLGAIPISEGTPVEYDSSMAEKRKKSGETAAPKTLPESTAVPEGQAGDSSSGGQQTPAAPDTSVPSQTPAAPEASAPSQTPAVPETPPAQTVQPEPAPAPEEPAEPAPEPAEPVPAEPEPEPAPAVPEQTPQETGAEQT